MSDNEMAERERHNQQWADYAWLIPKVISAMRETEDIFSKCHGLTDERRAGQRAKRIAGDILTRILTNK